MAEESKFIEVFIRRGIAPDAGGAWLLTRLVGIQKAKELFFFGDDVPARRGLPPGPGQSPRAPGRAARPRCRRWPPGWPAGPTKAIGMAKWLTNRALDVDRATSFQDEAMAQELITHTARLQGGHRQLRRAAALRLQGLVTAALQPAARRRGRRRGRRVVVGGRRGRHARRRGRGRTAVVDVVLPAVVLGLVVDGTSWSSTAGGVRGVRRATEDRGARCPACPRRDRPAASRRSAPPAVMNSEGEHEDDERPSPRTSGASGIRLAPAPAAGSSVRRRSGTTAVGGRRGEVISVHR